MKLPFVSRKKFEQLKERQEVMGAIFKRQIKSLEASHKKEMKKAKYQASKVIERCSDISISKMSGCKVYQVCVSFDADLMRTGDREEVEFIAERLGKQLEHKISKLIFTI